MEKRLNQTKEELIEEIKRLEIFKKIIVSTTEAIAISDENGKLLFINPAHEKLFGRSLEEAKKCNYRDYYPEKSIKILNEEVVPILKKGGSWEGILEVNDVKGRCFPLWEKADSILDDNQKMLYGFGIMHDVSREKELENQLKKNKFWLKKAQEVARIGHWVWEMKTQKLHWSDEVYRIFGVEPNSFAPSVEAFESKIHPDDLADFLFKREQMLNEKKDTFIEHRIILPTGEIRYVIERSELLLDEKGNVESVLGTVQDITDYKTLQNQLIQSEKLSAVGQLAAGIAHEFNNILAINHSNIQLLELTEKNNISEESLELLESIKSAIKRGAAIVSNMIAFAKPLSPKKELIKIEDIIENVLKMQKQQIALENIEIDRRYEQTEKVYIDNGQFQQVFLNLIINARHAILPNGKGKITLSVKTKNNKVEIKVIDDGIGIDNENLKNIFIPFYSTKGAHARNNHGIKGTGLGLAVTHTIIKNHNGTIRVESEKDKGATFIIDIPTAENKTETLKKDTKEIINEVEQKLLNVLIIDDEQVLLSTMTQLFRINNCEVKSSISGFEGIKLAKDNKFDIIFLDMLLPDISGENIFIEVRKFDTDVPIVFISGQIGIEIEKIKSLGAYDFIQKPFDMVAVKKILNEIRKKK
ncbi:PAS domain S-box protein [Candidatus Dependentiae bacterium]|nr:PAS domain S-box protein [Candidatus Dependentiae bacterium]